MGESKQQRAPKGAPKPSRYTVGGEPVFNRAGQEGWRLRFSVGKTRSEKLFWGTYEQAVVALSSARDEATNIGSIPVDRQMTLSTFLKDWTAAYRFVDGEERPATTWREHDGNRVRYIEPALARLGWEDKRLTSFTGADVVALVEACRPKGRAKSTTGKTQSSSGGSLSPTMRKSVRKTLRLVFGDAVHKGVISSNVAAGGDTTWRVKAIDTFVPTPHQMLTVARLMDASQKVDDPYLGSMLEFLYFTGLRISEALALKLADCRTRNSYLAIQGKATVSGGRRVESTTLKTTLSNRQVTLLPEARRAFRVLAANAQRHKSDYLFCGQGRRAHRKAPDGSWVTTAKPESIGYGALAKALRDACAEAVAAGEIPVAFTLHDCRHGYATLLRTSGIPDTEIAEEMGHASARLIRTLYGAAKFDADQSDKARAQSAAIRRLLLPDERDEYDDGADDIGPLFPDDPDWRDGK